MLEIYESHELSRELIKKMEGETIEFRGVTGYLLWLDLVVEGKVLLELLISPHQLGRLGKYLLDGVWRGGIICPQKTRPENFDISEVNDQARYQRILQEINSHRKYIEENKDAPAWMTETCRKMLPALELEALMLKDSRRFGLRFWGASEPEPKTDLTEWKRKLFEV